MALSKLLLVLVACAWLTACGDEASAPQRPVPDTGLAAALATVSETEPVGTGFGWIDVAALRESGRPLRAELAWAAGALGPGGRDVAEHPAAMSPSGADPLRADGLLAIATSYTLALRLDGVDPHPVERAFLRAGARRSRAGEWTNLDLGAEWTVAADAAIEPVGSLAARSAVRPDAVLLARSELARDSMESDGPPAIEAGPIAAAADCLGEVVAARLVLNNHTHLPNSGPDLLAFGVAAGDTEPAREVLCAIGGPRERVDAAAAGLEEAFAPGARDAVSDEPMDELVANAEVGSYDFDGTPIARASLDLPPGAEPGFVFGAFDRGSTVTYLGLQPPPTPSP